MKNFFKRYIYRCMEISVNLCQTENIRRLVEKLEILYPSLIDARTNYVVSEGWLTTSFRNLDAFQIDFVLSSMATPKLQSVIDIGDSDGRHIMYLKALVSDKINSLSVNLDPEAVKRIQAKGLDAVCEDATLITIDTEKSFDIALCFETLEHLSNPVAFLRGLASNRTASTYIFTVPFVSRSKVSLNYIRRKRMEIVSSENVHIFE